MAKGIHLGEVKTEDYLCAVRAVTKYRMVNYHNGRAGFKHLFIQMCRRVDSGEIEIKKDE